jgi:ParB-like chromosome segregation protein Spo0J
MVPIDSVVIGETPRLNGVSPEHVHILGKMDAALPPILVERSTMRVIDGMHRLHAALASGQKTIEVEFFEGCERTVFVQAVKANITHGLPLSLADRRAAAKRIIELYPEWSDRMVAASSGLSDKTVAAIRRCSSTDAPQLNARIGRDGRARPLNSTVGRWIASELIEERPHASLREIAREAGISVATVRDVRERLRRGDGPIPAMVGGGNAGRRTESMNGARPATTSVRAVDGTGGELDGSPLLDGLKKDPSLRYNEVGRALLRWLDLRTIRTKELEGFAERVPPHAAVIVAKVARRCATVWDGLAEELELRTQDLSQTG